MKILVVRLSSIGDIVLTTPVVRVLRQRFPEAEIHYLTKPQYERLVAPNPNVDKVWLWQEDTAKLFKELKAERFDELIDLHRNIRTLRLKLALRKRGRSFRKLNLRKWIWTNFKWNSMPKVNVVNRYLDTVKGLDAKDDGKGLEYFLAEEDGNCPEFQQLDLDADFAVLAIGGQYQTKRMPISKWREVVSGLDCTCFIIGGPGEKQDAQQLGQGLDHVVDLCGKLTLGNSSYLISRSRVVVTHDTGMMHVASAFQRPIVSIWGNTHPDLGMYAYLPEKPGLDHRHEVHGLSCRPCSKIGHAKCPKGHFKCMIDQNTTEIQSDIKEIIGTDRAPSEK